MKKLLLAFVCTAFAGALAFAQPAKRYVLLEHFTNSRCSICASKNPGFYTSIAPYDKDIHHISIHPSVPYQSCVFYQANKTENQGRADFYGIPGTPRVAVNGTLLPNSSALLPLATLQAELTKTSNLAVKVSDTKSGSNFTTTVDLNVLGTLPAGDYRLFVALVEKKINQTTPNGEAVHHDVFRDMLTSVSGDAITLGGAGTTTKYTFSVTANAAWNSAELYALAFVQNTGTKEVLNSGTRFDPVTTGTQEPLPTQVRVYPNPVQHTAIVPLPDEGNVRVEAFDLGGRRHEMAYAYDQQQVTLETAQLPAGVYVLKMVGRDKVYTARMVKH